MDAVVFLFPLLDLPTKALTNVLKSMEPIDILAFSLISKATKSLVVPLNFKSMWPSIALRENLYFHISLYRCGIDFVLSKRATDHSSKLTVADSIEVTKKSYDHERGTTRYQWTRPGFGIREWIEHLKDVTKVSNINRMSFPPESELYDIHSVAETIRGLGVLEICAWAGCSNSYIQLIQKTILTPRVRLCRNPYPDRESLQKVLVSNYELIYIGFGPAMTLGELLVLNCKYLQLSLSSVLEMKTLNKFLKLWRTGFNTKLRYMMVLFDRGVLADSDVILKGISHDVVDRGRGKEFTVPAMEGECVALINGGYDIQGAHGMKATLIISSPWTIEVFIWD